MRAASRPRAASMTFWAMRFASWGLSSRKAEKRSLTRLSTMPLTSELPSLPLVWPSNCGFGTLTETTAERPSRVSSPWISPTSFRRLLAWAKAVEAAGEAPLKPDEVGAAVVGVDVVGEAEDVLVVAVVPLHRDLDHDAVPGALEVDRGLVQHLLVAVQVLHEARDAALVLEALLLAVALVLEGDEDAPVQEGELAQPLGEGVGAVDRGLEDLGVGLEGDLGAAPVGDPGVLELAPEASRARSSGGRPSCRARSRPRGARRGRSPPRRRPRAGRPRPCRRPCRTCPPRGAW